MRESMNGLSPLAEIEASVQSRAKDRSLDTRTPGGLAELQGLLTEEIGRWRADYRRGARPFDLVDPEAVADRAYRNLAGYGPLEPLLSDDDVWEIMINAPDAIFVRRHVGPSGYHDEVFHDDEHVVRTLTKILDDASTSHRKLDPAEGLQDAQLDSGARIHIVHRDIGRDGHLLINIRKFTGVPFRSLEELVDSGSLDAAAGELLRACVRARLSIVFAGVPGSGKTTLLSCCAAELDPGLRVVIAEEVFETDVPLPNVASMQTRPQRADRAEVDLRRLVAGFLRMAPDVAIVGEVRDRDRSRPEGYRRCIPVQARGGCRVRADYGPHAFLYSIGKRGRPTMSTGPSLSARSRGVPFTCHTCCSDGRKQPASRRSSSIRSRVHGGADTRPAQEAPNGR